MTNSRILHVKSNVMIGPAGRPVILQGVNVGGWLMMEGYILHAPNRAVSLFKRHFEKVLDKKTLIEFEQCFQANFITEHDFARIARLGFNCVRVPFQYSLIERQSYTYDPEGLRILDTVLRWGEKYKLYIILDLHGACGSQNFDWHSDSLGKARLWTNPSYQKRTCALWEVLAERYKDKEYLAGYDILNEAVTDDLKGLNSFYRHVIQAIRRHDKNHILFIEGNTWATDLSVIDPIEDHNYVLSIHSYVPGDFTFNFVPQLSYPLNTADYHWDRNITRHHLRAYKKISEKWSAPIFVGEFGVNARLGLFNEHKWVEDMMICFKEFDFHWTYWTYKSVKNSAHPDGLYCYLKNPPWVNRGGPLMGWETYHLHWRTSKKDMIASWKTDCFEPNRAVLKVLQNYVS